MPLYTDYVEKARVTEATSIMGAIITSQKIEKQRTTDYYDAGPDPTTFRPRGIDITDVRFFSYQTAADGATGGFWVQATSLDAFGTPGGWIRYTYDPTVIPPALPSSWTADTVIITDDMLPTAPSGS